MRVLLADSEEFWKRKVVIRFPKPDLRKFGSPGASSRKRIRPLAFSTGSTREERTSLSLPRGTFAPFDQAARKTIDCLIATFCLTYGHSLLHRDHDFDPSEKHLSLKVILP